MINNIKVKNVYFGPKHPLALIAGPCVIESKLKTTNIAQKLIELTKKEKCLLSLRHHTIKPIEHL